MKSKKIPLLLLIGMILLVCGLLCVAVLQIHMHTLSQKSQTVAGEMKKILPNRVQGTGQIYADTQMPILEMDGTDYVGLLEIKAHDTCIPVANRWEQSVLPAAAGRFWGSAYDHTLVICGPDYPKQFGFCDDIDLGTAVTFMDMTGTEFAYTVTQVDRAKKADNGWLMNEEFDLTLFCRDATSFEYIAVRCKVSGQ